MYTAPYFSPDNLSPIRTVEASLTKRGEDIIFGASDGFLYLLNAKTGTQVERVNLGSPIFSQVSISNDRYYVSCYDGNVYCFKL
ncbi:MAG: hypothetical protein EOO20_23700 [Chryseobacterium sp.]|nr:MAG: hypothetical protein EOO20_23700 [Chryseobacterium sp.]